MRRARNLTPLTRRRYEGKRRDIKLIMFLVLKCINEQSKTGGTSRHDILYRCELNHYYLASIMEKLLEIQAIYTVDDTNKYRSHNIAHYLTQKGLELFHYMEREMTELGFNTTINNPRVKIR